MNKRQYRKNLKNLLLIKGRTGKGTLTWNMDVNVICYKRFQKNGCVTNTRLYKEFG